MLYEFAVDPQVLTSWRDVQLALERFGVHRGRLIAKYPNNWRYRVVEAVDQSPDLRPIDRQRVVERLRSDFPSRMWRRGEGRAFDGNQSWLDNARTCMAEGLHFRAVVADADMEPGNWLLAWDDLTDTSPELWHVPECERVPANACAMAKCIAPVLRNSNEILLVDPYFKPKEPRYRNPLREIAATASWESTNLSCVEYHTSISGDGDDESFRRDCERLLPNELPDGVQVDFMVWTEGPQGRRLLDRYILTDVVGVKVGHDLKERTGGETEFLLMNEDDRARMWGHLQQETSPFALAQQFSIHGARQGM